MKKQILLLMLSAILMLITLSCDLSPVYAANKTCDCLQESASLWKQDEKLNAFTKFAECGQLQEDYKKQFSGSNLSKFNEEYDKCLQETIKGEMLHYFLK
jgi:hypothetical protein